MEERKEYVTETTHDPWYIPARILSGVLNPFLVPFLAFVGMFVFTYLRVMTLQYKLILLGIIFCFTILIPLFTIYMFRKINNLGYRAFAVRQNRIIPYILTIISYIFCYFILRRLKMPWYMIGILLSALFTIIGCFLINLKWKVSEHMAGMGGIIAELVAFSAMFGFNPLGWLCIFILLAGLLGTCRIYLEEHSFGEVFTGFGVGFFVTFLILHPVTKFFIVKFFI
ncbi:MAG: hypothetical protein LUE93_15500 [Bacteroides sp.]|nr:hypothetical protein [Bacteroides sp.]